MCVKIILSCFLRLLDLVFWGLSENPSESTVIFYHPNSSKRIRVLRKWWEQVGNGEERMSDPRGYKTCILYVYIYVHMCTVSVWETKLNLQMFFLGKSSKGKERMCESWKCCHSCEPGRNSEPGWLLLKQQLGRSRSIPRFLGLLQDGRSAWPWPARNLYRT